MTWFRIDDSFYDHPKVFDAPDCAVALWTRAGTWSARNLTDGFVPTGMPARLCDDHATATKELLRRGLWMRTTGGFLFHDWTDFQPTAEAVKTLREQRAEAGRRGGKVRAERQRGAVDNGVPEGRNTTVTENRSASGARDGESPVTSRRSTTSGSVANAKQPPSKSQAIASPVAKQNAAPTRPDPFIGGALSDLPTPAGAQSEGPPAPTCPEHQGMAEPPPCGRCADARRARERWDLADTERRRTASKCRHHRGQPAGNCALCRSEALAAEETP